jgi:hypothetical protein
MPTPPPGFELDPKETLPAGFEFDPGTPASDEPVKPENRQPNAEETFRQKISDYGKELAHQLGLTARWGAEGAAGAIGALSDPPGQVAANILGMQYEPLSELVSRKLTDLGVPEPKNEAEKIVGEITKTIAGTATGVGVANKIAGGVEGLTGQVAKSLASQPTQQLTGATGAAAGQQAAEKAGAGEVGQVAASLVGGVLGAKAGGIPNIRTAAKEIPQGLQAAEERGIKVMTTDVIKPKTRVGETVQRFEKAQRVEQMAQRKKAATDFIRQYGADVDAELNSSFLGEVYDDFKHKRKFKVDKYNELKTDVINKLDDKGTMPINKTAARIDKEIAKLQKFDPENNLIDFYENFKSKLQNKSIGSLEELRKDLGDEITKASTDPLKPINKRRGDAIAKKVYESLNEDMGNFIKARGEPKDYNKWRAGNKKLSDMMKELEVKALERTLNNGEATPETIKTMLVTDKPSINRTLYKNLTPTGKKHARTALIQEALYRASKGNIDELSADVFKNKLRDLQRNTKIFFHKEDKRAIEGLYRALKLTEDAGKIVAGPPTGALNIPILTSMLGAVGAGGGFAAGGGDPYLTMAGAAFAPMAVAGYTRIYNSRTVRNILLKLPSLKRGSPEEAKLVKRLWTTMQDQYDKQNEEKKR